MNGIGSVFAFVGAGLAACILTPTIIDKILPGANRTILKQLHSKPVD